MTLRFPSDIGAKANSSNFPYVQFSIGTFRERYFIEDATKGSSIIDQQQVAKIQQAQGITPNPNESAAGLSQLERFNLDQSSLQVSTSINSTADASTILETIWLPVPQNFQNEVRPNWELSSMQITNSTLDAIDSGDPGVGLGMFVRGTLSAISGQMTQKLLGATPNPKKQALFNGIEQRTFQFDYLFTPQSATEARTIEQIIYTFTKYSLPTLINPTDALYGFPGEIKIDFYNITGVPQISWTVCTGVSTNYAPNIMQLLKSGHTVQVAVSLIFMETSLRTQEDPGLAPPQFGPGN